MTKPMNTGRGFVRIGAILLLLAGLSRLLTGQTLQITSPANGAVINSGQTLSVMVSADPSAFQCIAVIGQSPLGWTPLVTAAPYQFYITT